MHQNKGLSGWLCRRLELSSEALPGGFGLSLSGRGELAVSGCRRILSYSPTQISLSLGRLVLQVEGNDLLCTAFGAGGVTVRGRIDALRFEEVSK